MQISRMAMYNIYSENKHWMYFTEQMHAVTGTSTSVGPGCVCRLAGAAE